MEQRPNVDPHGKNTAPKAFPWAQIVTAVITTLGAVAAAYITTVSGETKGQERPANVSPAAGGAAQPAIAGVTPLQASHSATVVGFHPPERVPSEHVFSSAKADPEPAPPARSLRERVADLRDTLGKVDSNIRQRRDAVVELMRLSRERSVELQNLNIIAGNLVKGLKGQKLSLVEADFRGADLRSAVLSNAVLRRADLRDSKLWRAIFRKSSLRWARLQDADCRHANFSGAEFEGANLEGTNLDSANLENAEFQNARLRGARNLTQKQLEVACGNDKTTLPPGLTLRPCGTSAIRRGG